MSKLLVIDVMAVAQGLRKTSSMKTLSDLILAYINNIKNY